MSFIDKKHKEHWSVIWSVALTLIIASLPLFFSKELSHLFWKVELVHWMVFITLPVLGFLVFLVIKKYDDPNYDWLRLFNIFIALGFAITLMVIASQYRADKEDHIEFDKTDQPK